MLGKNTLSKMAPTWKHDGFTNESQREVKVGVTCGDYTF